MASYKRCCLELLKWVSPRDLLLTVSQLSTFWFALTETNELWQVLVEEDCITPDPEISSPKEAFRYCRRTLALISPCSLYSFAPSTLSWRSQPLSIRVQVDYSSAWALTPECAFICTGGGRASLEFFPSAYKIRQSGAVRTLSALRDARLLHGTIAIYGYCYVFGGLEDSGVTDSVEKIRLERVVCEEWSRVGSMRDRRFSFTPCAWKERVYLAGGMTKLVEVFHPVSERFECLSVFVCETSAVASTLEGCLVVLTHDALYKENSNKLIKKLRPRPGNISGNMSPYISKGSMWFIQAGKEFGAVEINLETLDASHYNVSID